MKRGIITSPGKIERTDKKSVSFVSNFSLQDLFYYVLYWDKLVLPTNNIIHVGIPHEELLTSEKILERPRIQFNSWTSNIEDGSFDLFVKSQSIVANELIKSDKEFDWTFHQLGDEIVVGANEKTEFNSIKVELSKSLPVPSETVDIQEILEFKIKRKAELLALHDTLDSFYLEILKSPDRNLKTKKTLYDLHTAIENLNKVSNEKFSISSKYNLTAELNINGKNILAGIASGASFGIFSNPQLIPLTSVIGGLAGTINIKLNKTTSVEEAKNKLKLSFLSEAQKIKLI